MKIENNSVCFAAALVEAEVASPSFLLGNCTQHLPCRSFELRLWASVLYRLSKMCAGVIACSLYAILASNRFHRKALLLSETCGTDQRVPWGFSVFTNRQEEVCEGLLVLFSSCGQNPPQVLCFVLFLITNNAFNYLASYSTHITETDKSMMFSYYGLSNSWHAMDCSPPGSSVHVISQASVSGFSRPKKKKKKKRKIFRGWKIEKA